MLECMEFHEWNTVKWSGTSWNLHWWNMRWNAGVRNGALDRNGMERNDALPLGTTGMVLGKASKRAAPCKSVSGNAGWLARAEMEARDSCWTLKRRQRG